MPIATSVNRVFILEITETEIVNIGYFQMLFNCYKL